VQDTALAFHPRARLANVSGALRDGVPGCDRLADSRGAAAVEFALLLPVLVTLVIGMSDYGALIYQSMQVSAAAHAGALYALRNGYSAGAIQTAVVGATTLTVTASPAPQLVKACVIGGAVVVTAGSTCPSGGAPGSYVIVNAQAAVTPIVAFTAFVMPSTLSSQAMIRIQ
jgi:Flp pilus assembly protein TadG